MVADEPSYGIHQFVESYMAETPVIALVYPDRRGDGYGLTRYEDNQQMDFSQIETCDDVRFAHKRGFVAKTTATNPTRLKELLVMSWIASRSDRT